MISLYLDTEDYIVVAFSRFHSRFPVLAYQLRYNNHGQQVNPRGQCLGCLSHGAPAAVDIRKNVEQVVKPAVEHLYLSDEFSGIDTHNQERAAERGAAAPVDVRPSSNELSGISSHHQEHDAAQAEKQMEDSKLAERSSEGDPWYGAPNRPGPWGKESEPSKPGAEGRGGW